MYSICKKLIVNGNYDKEDMLKKLDLYLMKDRITAEQYEELTNLIEGGN